MIDEIQKRLLKEVADLDSLPIGAYNIRANGAPPGAIPPPTSISSPKPINPALISSSPRHQE